MCIHCNDIEERRKPQSLPEAAEVMIPIIDAVLKIITRRSMPPSQVLTGRSRSERIKFQQERTQGWR